MVAAIKSELIYTGRAFSLRRDTLSLPDGRTTQLDIIAHVDSVVILALDAQREVLFVRQYRHAARCDLLELPAGVFDPGEAAEDCARRELREETGMAAGALLPLGGFFLAAGYSSEYMHAFLATDLRRDPLTPDSDEFLSVEKVPLGEVFTRIARGDLPDAKSLAALLLARPHLGG